MEWLLFRIQWVFVSQLYDWYIRLFRRSNGNKIWFQPKLHEHIIKIRKWNSYETLSPVVSFRTLGSRAHKTLNYQIRKWRWYPPYLTRQLSIAIAIWDFSHLLMTLPCDSTIILAPLGKENNVTDKSSSKEKDTAQKYISWEKKWIHKSHNKKNKVSCLILINLPFSN